METIGVTGVGGGVGQSIIKALQPSGHRIVGMDGEVLGAGLYAVDRGYTVPYANAPGYIERVLDVCRDNGVRLLFPGLDAELYPLSEHRERFAAIGTTVVVSSRDVIDVSENKLLTFERLTALGFHVPQTYVLETTRPQLEYPFIVKPYLGGARSKDVFLVKHAADFDAAVRAAGDRRSRFIAQAYLPGDEFTCGTVTVGDRCRGAIVMKRELRAGDTYKCSVVRDQALEEHLVAVMNALQPEAETISMTMGSSPCGDNAGFGAGRSPFIA
ncbi:MAG: ATP-grasp domain-containing protein, partial [Polyangiales bacterium]